MAKTEEKFDIEAEAHRIETYLKTASAASERPGGSVLSQRMVDYASNALCGLAPEQREAVLSAMDKKAKKNILKDGHGNCVGYQYSSEIFVSLLCAAQGDGQGAAPAWLQNKTT